MSLFANKYRVESTRLQGWNYSLPGYYFVTLCIKDWGIPLGFVRKGRIQLSNVGKIAADEWRKAGKTYINVKMDEWVIMPNHLHGIVVIEDNDDGCDASVETVHELFLREPPPPQAVIRQNRRRMLLSKMIGKFKMRSAKRINILQNTIGKPFWQARFYDHIIKDNLSLERIRAYIRNNPKAWNRDRNNVEDIFM